MGCTLLPFALSLAALRHVSAFSTAIALNMEPVYAIVMAIVLLGEQRELSSSFYLGVAIVVAAVFLHPWMVRPTSDAAAADHPIPVRAAELDLLAVFQRQEIFAVGVRSQPSHA